MRIIREIKYFLQRLARGFSDKECWCLDTTIAKFIIPRLRRMKEIGQSYPPDFKSFTKWCDALDKMIWSFEFVLRDYGSDDYDFKNKDGWELKQKMRMERYTEGMQLFAKYYNSLWD